MPTVAETFGNIINTMQGVTGPVSRGRPVVLTQAKLVGGTYVQMPSADLIITLDKEDFARLMGRAEAYKNIPAFTGPQVLWDVALFLVGDDGPIMRAFEQESEPKGTEWRQLSETQARMRGLHAGHFGVGPRGGVEKIYHPILNETGQLKALFSKNASDIIGVAVSGKYARLVISPEELDGVPRFKFFVHQLGSENGWGRGIKIPARPFLPESINDLTVSEKRKLNKIVEEGIKMGIMDRAARYGYQPKFRGKPL